MTDLFRTLLDAIPQDVADRPTYQAIRNIAVRLPAFLGMSSQSTETAIYDVLDCLHDMYGDASTKA